jgi:hypothetical protein
MLVIRSLSYWGQVCHPPTVKPQSNLTAANAARIAGHRFVINSEPNVASRSGDEGAIRVPPIG